MSTTFSLGAATATSPIAALSMYDMPELREQTDSLWRALAAALRSRGFHDAPETLCRNMPDFELWTDSRLLVAQTCGYPLTHQLAGKVRLLATPCYRAPGCSGPHYSSMIMVRKGTASRLDDLRGRRAAFNAVTSQSGYAALRAAVAPLSANGRFFGELLETGAHVRSLAAVQGGQADTCAVDAVLHALLARWRPDALAGLEAITSSPPAPGLPLVTSIARSDAEVDAIREALGEVAAEPSLAEVREKLLLEGFATLSLDHYDAILAMEEDCKSWGFGQLA